MTHRMVLALLALYKDGPVFDAARMHDPLRAPLVRRLAARLDRRRSPAALAAVILG